MVHLVAVVVVPTLEQWQEDRRLPDLPADQVQDQILHG
jgi:hypothetical protein